jgi:hypothetical protein
MLEHSQYRRRRTASAKARLTDHGSLSTLLGILVCGSTAIAIYSTGTELRRKKTQNLVTRQLSFQLTPVQVRYTNVQHYVGDGHPQEVSLAPERP